MRSCRNCRSGSTNAHRKLKATQPHRVRAESVALQRRVRAERQRRTDPGREIAHQCDLDRDGAATARARAASRHVFIGSVRRPPDQHPDEVGGDDSEHQAEERHALGQRRHRERRDAARMIRGDEWQQREAGDENDRHQQEELRRPVPRNDGRDRQAPTPPDR